ncbi:MAG: Hpt domain-containing protein [Treponema sp.]|jgi:HPt (histidine-containing phosphotransfer) domain-containing protein|nr:Hpt domain-containing protein [Treponema sp.]
MADTMRELNESETVYINVEEGLKRVMHNKALYVKLLRKLKTDTHFTDLITALQAQDYENAQTVTHAIKGMAANLSLTELFTRALQLERYLKNRTIYDNSLEMITRCYEKTLISIDEVLEQYE